MERKSYQPAKKAEQEVEWSKLIETAMTMPGSMGDTYSRFYNYSFGNQILLYMQGVREPINTFDRWKAMGRQVQKGSKAKSILRPTFRKATNEDGIEETKVAGFKMVKCLFGVSDTEGDELPEYEPKVWSRERALGALAIRQVTFDLLDGNTAGYSVGRDVAINPVAKYPLKTLVHEMGHVVLGHTTPDAITEYQQHRGTKEFQAESVAYLTMNELDAMDAMNASESRAYIQYWLNERKPDNTSIKQVFTSVDKILRAGRSVSEEEPQIVIAEAKELKL